MNEKFSDERISAYLDDELAADERAAVERELADNADLRQAVDELRALRTGLQSLPRYRLETNIAERVLELAEREILTGGNRQNRDVALAAATDRGGAAAAHATESHATESHAAASHADGRPQPSRRSDAPSARREGGFSWRNLVWSATAAGVAAMLMHFYHTTNRAQPLANAPADRQVASADESRSDRQASRNEGGPSAGDEMATSTSIEAAPVGPPRDQQATTRRNAPALDAAADRAVADRAVADRAVADATADAPANAGIAADSAAAAEGKTDDLPPSPSSSLAKNAADARGSGGSAEERKADDENALGGVGAASLAEDRGGFGGVRRGRPLQQAAADEASSSSLPVSFIMLSASPEALRDRVFDGFLESNRVAVVDDRPGGGDLAMRAAGGERGGGSAAVESAAGDDLRQSAAAGRGGKDFSAEPELYAVDMTPEQLKRVLAAVNRSSDDFAVVREFPVGAENLLFAESRRAMSRDEDEFAADGASKENDSVKKAEGHGEKTTDAKPGDVATASPAAPQGKADDAPADLPPEQDSEPSADAARSTPDRRNGRNGAGDRRATTLPADAMKDEGRPKPNAPPPRSLEQGDAAPGKTRAQARPGAASRAARSPVDKSFRGGLEGKGADNDRRDGNRENGNRQDQGDKQGKKPEQAMPPAAEAPHEAAKAEAAIAEPPSPEPAAPEPAAPEPAAPEPTAPEPAAPVVAADEPKSAANAVVESPPSRAAGGRPEAPPEGIARRVRPRSADDLKALSGELRRGRAQVESVDAPRSATASGALADAPVEKSAAGASLAEDTTTRIRVYFYLQPAAVAPSNALAAPAADDHSADAPAAATPAESSPADAASPASPE